MVFERRIAERMVMNDFNGYKYLGEVIFLDGGF